jgi:hypothetical protein
MGMGFSAVREGGSEGEGPRGSGPLRVPCFYLAAALLWAVPCTLQAQSRVLVFRTAQSPSRPGLVDALRIQLAGKASVEIGGELSGSALTDRIYQAVASVRKQKAALAVWVQGPVRLSDGSQELILYLVGENQGRAVVEVLRVPGGAGPEADRTLSLKTREVLDNILDDDRSSSLLRASRGRETVAASSGWGWLLDLGLEVGSQPGSDLGQWGLGMGAGARLRISDLSLAAQGLFRFFPSVEIESEQGRVSYRELGPGLAILGLLHASPLAVGLQLGSLLRLVDAKGMTPAGETGSRQELVPVLFSLFQVELELGLRFASRIGAGLEINLRRQRFAVNGREVADLGRVRPMAQAALVFHLQ